MDRQTIITWNGVITTIEVVAHVFSIIGKKEKVRLANDNEVELYLKYR